MKVTELQSFVRTLAQPLSSVGVSKTVCADLERVAAGFEPFGHMTMAQLADFLVKAEEYHRTGVLAAPAKPTRAKAAKASALSIPEAVQRVQKMYAQAADPALTYAAIDAEIKQLDNALNKEQALAVAKESGVAITPKTKKAALEEIKRRIVDRKGSYERTQFRDPTPALFPPS